MEPEFKAALTDYTDLAIQWGGENPPANFLQCLEAYKNGEVALWFLSPRGSRRDGSRRPRRRVAAAATRICREDWSRQPRRE